MVNNYWETLEQRHINADMKMYHGMFSGTVALDESRFNLHFSAAHNIRHGATKGTISTDVAKYSLRRRIHKLLLLVGPECASNMASVQPSLENREVKAPHHVKSTGSSPQRNSDIIAISVSEPLCKSFFSLQLVLG